MLVSLSLKGLPERHIETQYPLGTAHQVLFSTQMASHLRTRTFLSNHNVDLRDVTGIMCRRGKGTKRDQYYMADISSDGALLRESSNLSPSCGFPRHFARELLSD